MSEWDSMPHNSKHLMREAARRGYTVLYVDPIGLRRPKAQRKDLQKIGRRLRRARRPLVLREEGIWSLSPVALPLQASRAGDAANRWLVGQQVAWAVRSLHLSRVVLWTYIPQLYDLGGRIFSLASVYYRTDDYPAMPGVDAASLRAWESKAVREVDLCIGAAERYLQDPFAAAHDTLFIPNAVDVSHYAVARSRTAILDHVQRPRLLMMGTLESWLDFELLAGVMRANSEWSLVLAGQAKVSLSMLTELENVTYLGQLDYGELPAVVHACDVGLIPFRVSKVTLGANPGKLFQYLAAGLPVVTTPFLNVAPFEGHVRAAPPDVKAFSAAIAEVTRRDSPERRSRRSQLAAKHSWSARFDEIEVRLERLLASPRRPSRH